MDFSKVQAYLEHLTDIGMPIVQLAVTKGRELVFSGSAGSVAGCGRCGRSGALTILTA